MRVPLKFVINELMEKIEKDQTEWKVFRMLSQDYFYWGTWTIIVLAETSTEYLDGFQSFWSAMWYPAAVPLFTFGICAGSGTTGNQN